MTQPWRDDQPIYRQIRDKMIAAILDGSLKEGEAIPSVRAIAVELQVNPLTVSRAYQELADTGFVERRRGLGMYVTQGARDQLGVSERDQFLKNEWPTILARIERLGLKAADLLSPLAN